MRKQSTAWHQRGDTGHQLALGNAHGTQVIAVQWTVGLTLLKHVMLCVALGEVEMSCFQM